jgi:hypothetical protein
MHEQAFLIGSGMLGAGSPATFSRSAQFSTVHLLDLVTITQSTPHHLRPNPAF